MEPKQSGDFKEKQRAFRGSVRNLLYKRQTLKQSLCKRASLFSRKEFGRDAFTVASGYFKNVDARMKANANSTW